MRGRDGGIILLLGAEVEAGEVKWMYSSTSVGLSIFRVKNVRPNLSGIKNRAS